MARGATRPLSLMSCTKVSTVVLVAASDFATDSVEGQRWRPSGVMRLDLLKVVGSSPARLASPDADSPERAASRSRAFQICAWVSMSCPLVRESRERGRNLVKQVGIITKITISPALFSRISQLCNLTKDVTKREKLAPAALVMSCKRGVYSMPASRQGRRW